MSDAALSAGETSLVTITFSEAVTGFANADLTIENGTLGTLTSTNNITIHQTTKSKTNTNSGT
jgi:hypothetical protein